VTDFTENVMTSLKISALLAGAALLSVLTFGPAHALTMMQAPVDSNGQNFADPDSKTQNNFSSGQGGSQDTSRGLHFSVGPGTSTIGPNNQPGVDGPARLTDPSSPYYNPPRYFGPGMPR
jgi:hypothetical protein